ARHRRPSAAARPSCRSDASPRRTAGSRAAIRRSRHAGPHDIAAQALALAIAQSRQSNPSPKQLDVHASVASGRRTNLLLVPRFRSSSYAAAIRDTNFGSKGALEILMKLVPLFDLKFLTEPAASVVGTSNRRH